MLGAGADSGGACPEPRPGEEPLTARPHHAFCFTVPSSVLGFTSLQL